jgi:hypothetical protein
MKPIPLPERYGLKQYSHFGAITQHQGQAQGIRLQGSGVQTPKGMLLLFAQSVH